jgi:hypothetical protein
MDEISGILVGTAFLAAVIWCIWLGTEYMKPRCKSNEYIEWYKVGRIQQFAAEHNINIAQVIAKDELRDNKKIQRTWTEKIEAELSKDLAPIEAMNEPINKKRGK